MKTKAWGEGRNCGTHTLIDHELTGRRSFSIVKDNETDAVHGVRILTTGPIVMSGNYYLETCISKQEIARMFYETHSSELGTFAQAIMKFVPLERTFAPEVRARDEAAKQRRARLFDSIHKRQVVSVNETGHPAET